MKRLLVIAGLSALTLAGVWLSAYLLLDRGHVLERDEVFA